MSWDQSFREGWNRVKVKDHQKEEKKKAEDKEREEEADSAVKTLVNFFLKTMKLFFLFCNKQFWFVTYLSECFILHKTITSLSTLNSESKSSSLTDSWCQNESETYWAQWEHSLMRCLRWWQMKQLPFFLLIRHCKLIELLWSEFKEMMSCLIWNCRSIEDLFQSFAFFSLIWDFRFVKDLLQFFTALTAHWSLLICMR